MFFQVPIVDITSDIVHSTGRENISLGKKTTNTTTNTKTNIIKYNNEKNSINNHDTFALCRYSM